MTSTPLRRAACLFLFSLVPLISLAQEPLPPEPSETPAASGETPESTQQDAAELAFDPATIGLPELPQPMRSAADFQKTLDLIDAQIAEQEALIEDAEAADTGPSVDGTESEAALDQDASAAQSPDQAEPDVPATALSALTQRLELLRQLRIAVQRRATIEERVAASREEVDQRQAQLQSIEVQGVELEPPFSISQLDQQQAELRLRQAVEEVAETRLETASRRLAVLEKTLSAAVRTRRVARDELSTAQEDGAPAADLAQLTDALQLARLRELLARQEVAATERTLELTRQEDQLAELQQQILAARVAFLESRAELSAEGLEQRLAELNASEERLRTQVETLQRDADQAESALYEAQRRLDAAQNGEAGSAVLEEWVAARNAQLEAARSGVSSLMAAMADSAQMRQLWQLRFELMQAPETIDAAERLREVISTAATASTEKDDVEDRLNALRTIQLAQARRMQDPSVSESMREPLSVRAEAHEVAERYGRELLESKDALIALLAGMRHQLERLVEHQTLSLQLLQAQELLAGWWNAELIVIDDQSMRVRELVTALVMFLLVMAVVSLLRGGARRALNRRAAKSRAQEAGELRLVLSTVAGNTSQVFVLIAAFYLAMIVSDLGSPTVRDWLWTLLVIAFYAQLGLWANAAIADYFQRKRTRQEMRDPSTVTGYGVLMVFIRVGIWITVIVSLLAYFKYPIAGLLGALGVGSIAVGFALQNILGDVFSSMAIILDKPFRVGDFVKAGDTVGTIELIGIKTTRIRSLSGEQVVLSNSDLLNSRIHNFKHFRERRTSFRLGVVYQTPRELIERIPRMIREAIEEQPSTRFDRAHFCEFGDFSLNFEAVYYVLSPDYGLFMDIQQGINLGIHRRFEEAGVAFAYPTQELILRRG